MHRQYSVHASCGSCACGGSMSTATEVKEPDVKKPVGMGRTPQVPLSSQQIAARPMFADSLLESGGVKRGRQTVAIVFSFIFRCVLLGFEILIPLIFTEPFPKKHLFSFLGAPPP